MIEWCPYDELPKIGHGNCHLYKMTHRHSRLQLSSRFGSGKDRFDSDNPLLHEFIYHRACLLIGGCGRNYLRGDLAPRCLIECRQE